MQTSATKNSLSTIQQQQVIDETRSYIKKAEQLFNVKTKTVDINFSLNGRASGMYRIKRNNRLFSRRQIEIRYNPTIFSRYFEDNFKTTIPHEVAHFISDMIYGLKNIKPHGKEWKAIMHAFDADASVTANYDLSGLPLKRLSLYTYYCNCREHQLTAIRHNKITRRRYQYYCKNCKQILNYRSE